MLSWALVSGALARRHLAPIPRAALKEKGLWTRVAPSLTKGKGKRHRRVREGGGSVGARLVPLGSTSEAASTGLLTSFTLDLTSGLLP